jgi:hypothetical protein
MIKVATLLLLIFHQTHSAPCDIFAAGGTPCVAAHSMVRALYDKYNGSLYQLKRGSDNSTKDINVLANGFADAASHDAFCASADVDQNTVNNNEHSLSTFPSLGAIVSLTPVSLPGYRLRHCDSAGYITPFDWVLDHSFYFVNALNGASDAYSFQSVNYPKSYLSIITGEEFGRVGIAASPDVNEASWTLSAAPDGNGLIVMSQSRTGMGLSIGTNLTGNCASGYKSPSASVYIQSSLSAWFLTATEPAPVPPGECAVWRIYDQTGNQNHLEIAGPALNNPEYDAPVNASRHPLFVGGNKVYGAKFEGGMGYRAVNTSGVATGNDPETIYIVTSGKDYNAGCCGDYGNSENVPTDPSNFCDGCMEALYFGSSGGWCGSGNPTVLADLENGLWGCATPNGNNPNLQNLNFTFATAMVKGGTNGFALKGGDASSGTLSTFWDGPRPPGYQPMHKTGGIILGVGGDNVSKSKRKLESIPGTSILTFYEGALTSGVSSDATDDLVQEDIIKTGYGVGF